jgi:hypothetical protein
MCTDADKCMAPNVPGSDPIIREEVAFVPDGTVSGDCPATGVTVLETERDSKRFACRNREYTCPFCLLHFASERALWDHWRRHPSHRPGESRRYLTTRPEPVYRGWRCPACFRRFTSESALLAHLDRHPDHNPYLPK